MADRSVWRASEAASDMDGGRGEILQSSPTVLPGGNAILFTSATGANRANWRIEALSPSTGSRRVVVDSASWTAYAPNGHLIFFRNGALLAAPFDANGLELTGPPARVVENLEVDATGTPLAAVSDSGSLVYQASGAAATRLAWVSRQGVEQPITENPRPYQNPRVAPDGRAVVMEMTGGLWIHDTLRSTLTRLTSEQVGLSLFPVWTPDGKRVIFKARTTLQWVTTDGSDQAQTIPETLGVDFPSSVSPEGETLAFLRFTPETFGDIYVLSLRGEAKPRPVVKTAAFEGGLQFSPDGRWMAYASNESGQFQVYLRPFPGPDRKWQVSTEGGTSPRWNRNGRELFYRSGDKMMVADVITSPDLILSQPRLLFEQPYAYGSTITFPNYDVSPDGQRFVMVKRESNVVRLNVVLNWFDELQRLAAPRP